MKQEYLDRIERLRLPAINPEACYDEFYLHFYRRFSENAYLGCFDYRYTEALCTAFEKTRIVIDPDEAIVGRVSSLTAEEKAEWQALKEGIVAETAVYEGQDSHMAIDYPLVLTKGIQGILSDIEGKETPFYLSCAAALRAVIRFSERYSEACAEAGMTELARICAKVPRYPAETFHEAVQAVHFISFCLSYNPLKPVSQQFQLGRPDRYLLPYYEADIAAGRITEDDAQFLLDCLAIQINRRVPRGLSSGYMLGGRRADGSVVDNAITRMGMQVIDDIRLVYPSVGLCCCKDTPAETLQFACNVLSHGRSHPAIFNDDIISEGLQCYGIPAEDSHEYIHSTCVEITPIGASNVWVASPYTNMPQLLLDCLDREYDSFDALMTAFYARLDAHICRNFENENATRKLRAEKSVNPLLSCFVHDCLENGVDIEKGGARYNWIMPSFVGVANLTDALYILREAVFNQKSMTIAELCKALDANFEGCEALRLRLENGYPKYGNNDDSVDAIFCGIIDHIVAECKKYKPMFNNGRLIPSVFCWEMHAYFGAQTGATPDGRKAGFPLGDGSGPCQGREKHGPTASVLSSTKWSHKELIGGVAVNMKFPKKTFTAQSCKNVEALIRTYLARGGFEMQINVVDRDTLLQAQQHPEEYRDLVVRIGGYSDYFVNLSLAMQAEVLLRTEHDA